jgi:hypothetical protein
MSQSERTVDQPDAPEDTGTGSTFLRSIEFLTGQDPNLGSFLLVVGMVTAVFVALFQFTLPTPISHLLTAGVLFVTVLSAIFGILLDSFGYFDRSAVTETEAGDDRTGARPWVPADKASAPLPPLINFDAELRAYSDLFDGDLPAEFDPFISDYRRLKTSTRNRPTIASDLRADLNPIGALFDEGSEGDRIYEDVSQRLFRYISGKNGHVTLNRVTFYDEDDTETDVDALENHLGRVELDVTNEGEAADVEAVVTLYDEGGSAISTRTCLVGVVSPGATKVVSTDIFVPSEAERADTTIRTSYIGPAAETQYSEEPSSE